MIPSRPAAAEESLPPQTGAMDDVGPEWRLALGAYGGALSLDSELANFRWDVTPRPAFGLSAALERGRMGFGLSAWRSRTTQASGIPGETQAPDVSLVSAELEGRFRALEVAGFELWAAAHGGLLHLSYDPDRLFFDPFATGDPIEVAFDPINEWIGGAAISIRRNFFAQMALALQLDYSSFALDTSHRKGSEIIQERQAFHGWAVGLQVSWLVGLR